MTCFIIALNKPAQRKIGATIKMTCFIIALNKPAQRKIGATIKMMRNMAIYFKPLKSTTHLLMMDIVLTSRFRFAFNNYLFYILLQVNCEMPP